MEKPWMLWSFIERWLLALASWSWALCRISLLPLIVTFHLYGGIVLLLLIFVSIAGILYKFQDVLLYFPEQPSSSRLYVPMPTGIPHENIFIRTKDGVRLNLILVRYTGDNSPYCPTIIYFHGNAGNIGHRLPNALLMLVNLKVNLVLVDYRGYGKSEGEASEEGLYLDSEAVLDYVMTRPDLDKTKVFLFGRSLGGAVAIHLASENSHRISAIMVENTFLSIPHMASTLFSFFPMRYLPLWCYKNKFLSYRKISQCRMPSLFISGLSDQLIPPVMMKQLYELSPSRTKRLAIFPDGTHNDTWQCQGYFTALEQFIKEVIKSHSPEDMTKTSSNVTIIWCHPLDGGWWCLFWVCVHTGLHSDSELWKASALHSDDPVTFHIFKLGFLECLISPSELQPGEIPLTLVWHTGLIDAIQRFLVGEVVKSRLYSDGGANKKPSGVCHSFSEYWDNHGKQASAAAFSP